MKFTDLALFLSHVWLTVHSVCYRSLYILYLYTTAVPISIIFIIYSLSRLSLFLQFNRVIWRGVFIISWNSQPLCYPSCILYLYELSLTEWVIIITYAFPIPKVRNHSVLDGIWWTTFAHLHQTTWTSFKATSLIMKVGMMKSVKLFNGYYVMGMEKIWWVNFTFIFTISAWPRCTSLSRSITSEAVFIVQPNWSFSLCELHQLLNLLIKIEHILTLKWHIESRM